MKGTSLLAGWTEALLRPSAREFMFRVGVTGWLLYGLGHSFVGLFAMVMNVTPDDYLSGSRVLNYDYRAVGGMTALFGASVFWLAVYAIVIWRRERPASGRGPQVR